MANWNTLKTAVADIINTNGSQSITGQLLQNVLNNIITNVGENATFAGIATPETNPGAPDGPVFYLATTAGTYVNFNGIEVSEGEAVILLWDNGAWSKKASGFATQEKLSQLGSEVNTLGQEVTKLSGAVSTNKSATDKAIDNLSRVVSENKSATDKTIDNLSGVVSENKTKTDKAISALSSTVSANKSATDEAISALSSTVSANKTETDNKLSELGSKANDLENKKATKAELQAEVTRATNAENALSKSIESETTRATAAELELRKYINNEIIRAKESEEELENSINANRYGYNVTVNGLKGGVHTIETAIKDVPSKFRMLGQKITFRTENGDWATYHNESLSLDNYENVNDWVQEVGISSVQGDVNITNVPDYEDLTEASDGTIKFADKEYSKESFSGLGRVYLRKNIVEGIRHSVTIQVTSAPLYDGTLTISLNGVSYDIELIAEMHNTISLVAEQIAKISDSRYNVSLDGSTITFVAKLLGKGLYTNVESASDVGLDVSDMNDAVQINQLVQDMFVKPNTIYIIQYDYDLQGAEINVPKGCVLDFQGGSFSNGTIVGNNTAIKAFLTKIFGLDVELSSTWNVVEAYPEWFGAKGDGVTDDTIYFKKALSTILPVSAVNQYVISDTIQVFNSLDGKFKGRILSQLGEDNKILLEVSSLSQYTWARVSNMFIVGENNNGYGLYCHRFSEINHCNVQGFEYGIAIASYNVNLLYTTAKSNNVNIGIASAELHEGWIEQANAINIIGGEYTGAISKITIKIGNTPWFDEVEGGYYWGQRLLISQASLDKGYIEINDYGLVQISQCYFEILDEERFKSFISVVGDVQNLSIDHCYMNGADYGINIKGDVNRLSILNNTILGCKYTGIYLLNTPLDFQYKGNRIGANGYRAIHCGINKNSINDVNSIIEKIKRNTDIFSKTDYIYGEVINSIDRVSYNNNYFLTFNVEKAINGFFVEEGVFQLAESADMYNILSGSKIDEGNNCYISHIDLENRVIYLKSFSSYPDISLTKLTRPAVMSTSWYKRGDSRTNTSLFDDIFDGAIVYDKKYGVFNYRGSGYDRLVLSANRGYNAVIRSLGDLKSAITDGITRFIVTDSIELKNQTITLPSFSTIEFLGGNFKNGTLILDLTLVRGADGNLGNYFTNCVIEGTYREGQVLYDSDLKKQKLWNGSAWVNLDGSDL